MERMRTLYREVAGQLEQVELHRLWPGFRPYPFALYMEETVWLAERTLPRGEAFRGNTAISFQGSPLAIWQIETGTEPDPVELAADLVHEMFHAFQMEQREAHSCLEALCALRERRLGEQMAYELLADQEAPEVPADPAVEALLRDQRQQRQEILRQFFRRAAQPEAGDFVICGYDPMNLFPCGKLLYGSHFWLLQNRETGEQITLTGEAVLVRTGVRQASRYWRAQP